LKNYLWSKHPRKQHQPSNDGRLLDNDIGIRGGEAIFSDIDDLWEDSSVLGICNAATLAPLEGMEKLRAMAWGGIGSGDAALDATKLFAVTFWPLDTNGPEWPTKPKSLELEGKLVGGLGSSWSSLILGEVIRVGEALGDAFGDDDGGWGIGAGKRGPENSWTLSMETGLVGPGLLVNGPEKACLLIFLE